MDSKAIEKRWIISGSHCTETNNRRNCLHFEGTYFLNGVAFPFSCNEQTSGSHLLRGQVNVFAQSRGQLMRVRDKGGNEKPVMLSRSIYPNVLDRDGKPLPKELWRLSVMERVEYAAQSLLNDNRPKIKRDSELAAAPDTVTPQLALTLYCDAFMRVKHANASKESMDDYARLLTRLIRCLPNIPMKAIKPGEIEKAIKAANAGKQAQKLARDFWSFCLDAHYCTGSNPFPTAEKHRKSAKAKRAAADRLDVLDTGMQQAIYSNALQTSCGADCGLALMLWGGFTPKAVCALLWSDLAPFDHDFIRAADYHPDNAGATHDYGRLLMPQGSEIVLKRRAELLAKYGKTRLKKMPVVSLATNPEKAMRPDDLSKYVAGVLQRLVIQGAIRSQSWDLSGTGAVSICRKTYEYNLTHACCLKEDSGLVRFLSGKSLAGNVTADHYRSFTDADALALQKSVFRRMAPEKPIELEQEVDTSHPDYDVYRYAAPTTRDLISLSLELDGMAPDDVVSLLSRYGGDIYVEFQSE